MKRAVLYSNKENDIGQKTARRVADRFTENGWSVELCAFPNHPDLTNADMLITFGGDGTILHAARTAATAGVPILGVNMGGKGFIAELEPGDTKLIDKAARGEYDCDTRMMINVEVERDGKTLHRDFALNDAVIRGNNKVIEMTVYADGQSIIHFSGDGTIVSTPTGSTAYSMSAGGPIVEPPAENIIVTPICAHILEAKSFVLVAKRVITISIGHKRGVSAYVSIDGGDQISVEIGDIVKVSKSEMQTKLVYLSGKSFYHRLSEKLTSK